MLSQDAKLLLSKYPDLAKAICDEFRLSSGNSPFANIGVELAYNQLWTHFLSKNTEPKRDWVVLTRMQGGKIWTVLRLSDNQPFAVGDKTSKGVIENFSVLADEVTLLAEFKGVGSVSYDLRELKKAEPLFTTEDGKPVYEGDIITVVFTNHGFGFQEWEPKEWDDLSENNWDDTAKIFSTKEAAEEYIKLNKPCYSINDIKKAYKSPIPSPLWNEFYDNLIK